MLELFEFCTKEDVELFDDKAVTDVAVAVAAGAVGHVDSHEVDSQNEVGILDSSIADIAFLRDMVGD
eukprot:CAMPEP_0203702058 /NCGR_PEP_ID=MMETSP0091-20130426/38017_1 /ASSEMBLY_ACC=CAM_ASM_001089 /TAXON_ID=426623 /ORGANISM="Chaetoceros affinis, Strain CCMP159" /LENGTH=66 /DNA_ID=CAMNT_0050576067 /DNA_START=70 /DNA_END=268 /DNA_ORIENTATION=-